MAKDTTLLVATVKNEGPNILEWVAHHRLCGFDRIQVYQNESSDMTGQVLRTLDRIGAIEFHNNRQNKGTPQKRAHRLASRSDAFKNSTWCMVLDPDEFLNVKIGDRTVHALIDSCPEASTAILVLRRVFGSNGHRKFSSELITERFSSAEPAAHIKTFPRPFRSVFQTEAYQQPGAHLPLGPQPAGHLICNASGLTEDVFQREGGQAMDPGAHRYAQINHYMLRDLPSFLLKHARGAGPTRRELDLTYWRDHDCNDEEDTTLASRAFEIWAEMKRLDDQADGKLLRMRGRSQRQWRLELDEHLKDENVAALRDSILAEAKAKPMQEPFKLPGTSGAVFRSVRAVAEPEDQLKQASG